MILWCFHQADMSHLGTALLGRRVLDIAALELYEHLRDTTGEACDLSADFCFFAKC